MSKKVKTDRKVILHGKTASADGHLVDVSVQGVGVMSSRGAQVGTELDVEFELPAFQHFKLFHLHGVVTHRHNANDAIYLHIRFSDLNEKDRAAIQDFIDYKTRLSQLSKRKYN